MLAFDTTAVDKLAVDLDDFMYDFDYYDYMDSTDGDREKAINELKTSLYKGDVSGILADLQSILEEKEMDDDLSVAEETKIEGLITRTKRYEGACFRVYWTYAGKNHFGFIKASSPSDATAIALSTLRKDCKVTQITQAFEHQITRQNICLNFANPAPEPMFG